MVGDFDESEPTQAEKLEATKQYLGDGVYVTYDGYHVWAEAETIGGSNRIAFEPTVLRALVRYATNHGITMEG